MANYSRNFEVTLTESKASYGEGGIPTYKESDKKSKLGFQIRKDNKPFDLTDLKATLFVKDKDENIYEIDSTNFTAGGKDGKIVVSLTDEVLAVPSKYEAQLELKDDTDGSVYTFEVFELEVVDKWSVL